MSRLRVRDSELIAGILAYDLAALCRWVSSEDKTYKEVTRAIRMLVKLDDLSDVYRIEIGHKIVSVLCIGMEKIDSGLEGEYDSLDRLPTWVQERIAVLSMLSAKPPTENVEGVGRRVNETTYWVYRPSSQ